MRVAYSPDAIGRTNQPSAAIPAPITITAAMYTCAERDKLRKGIKTLEF
jgi:hypothetical protein